MISKNTRVIGLVVVIKQFINLIYQNISSYTLTQIDEENLNVHGLGVILVILLSHIYLDTKLVIIMMKDIVVIGLVVVVKQLKNLIYQDISSHTLTQIDHGLNVIGLGVILVTLIRRIY